MAKAVKLEEPLPKPRRDLLGYASARVLEALLESLLALEFLEAGYTRNAAGKAFVAWRALTAALLALEAERLTGLLGGEEEKRWLLEKAIPRVPSSRLKRLGLLLERLGVRDYSAYTDKALDLHDYQYHGPDPDAELSKYQSRLDAAEDILVLLGRLVGVVEEYVEKRLREAGRWSREHAETLKRLRSRLEDAREKLWGRAG